MTKFIVTGTLEPFAIGEKVRVTHQTGEHPQVRIDSVDHPNKQLKVKPQEFDRHKRQATLVRSV